MGAVLINGKEMVEIGRSILIHQVIGEGVTVRTIGIEFGVPFPHLGDKFSLKAR